MANRGKRHDNVETRTISLIFLLFSFFLYISIFTHATAGENTGVGTPLLIAGWFDDVTKSVGDSLKKADDYIQDKVDGSEEEQPPPQNNTGNQKPRQTTTQRSSASHKQKVSELTRGENREIQQHLLDLGYNPGQPDGQPGPKTRAAIREYQASKQLPVTGQESRNLLKQLRSTTLSQQQPVRTSPSTARAPSVVTEVVTPSTSIVLKGGKCEHYKNRVAFGGTIHWFLAATSDGSLLVIRDEGATLIPNLDDVAAIYPPINREIRDPSFVVIKKNGTATIFQPYLENVKNIKKPLYVASNKKLVTEKISKIASYPLTDIAKAFSGRDKDVHVLRKDCSLWIVRNNQDARMIKPTGSILDIFPPAPTNPIVLNTDGTVSTILLKRQSGDRDRKLKIDAVPGAYRMVGSYKHPVFLTTEGTVHDKNGKIARLNDITAIASGQHHFLALQNNGTVWSWGSNRSGQLGDGTAAIKRTKPVRVKGLPFVTEIAAGWERSAAVGSDGTLWAWGDNSSIGRDKLIVGGLGVGSTKLAISLPARVKLVGSKSLNLNTLTSAELASVQDTIRVAGDECAKARKLLKQGGEQPRSFNVGQLSLCVVKHGLSLKGTDLSNTNLEGLALVGADLQGTNFTGSNLFNSRFDKANIKGAIFHGADLKQANFTRADLRNVDFRNADLRMARFNYANVAGADFTGANYDTIYLPDADNISQAKGLSFGRQPAAMWAAVRPAAGKSDGSKSAEMLVAHFSGKSISYQAPAMQRQPAMDITVYPCSNGDFLFKDNLAGRSGNIGGASLRTGKWRVFKQGNESYIQLSFSDGEVAQYEAMVRGGETYIDGDRVQLSDNNPLCQ